LCFNCVNSTAPKHKDTNIFVLQRLVFTVNFARRRSIFRRKPHKFCFASFLIFQGPKLQGRTKTKKTKVSKMNLKPNRIAMDSSLTRAARSRRGRNNQNRSNRTTALYLGDFHQGNLVHRLRPAARGIPQGGIGGGGSSNNNWRMTTTYHPQDGRSIVDMLDEALRLVEDLHDWYETASA
jgi:hypothetical protein